MTKTTKPETDLEIGDKRLSPRLEDHYPDAASSPASLDVFYREHSEIWKRALEKHLPPDDKIVGKEMCALLDKVEQRYEVLLSDTATDAVRWISELHRMLEWLERVEFVVFKHAVLAESFSSSATRKHWETATHQAARLADKLYCFMKEFHESLEINSESESWSEFDTDPSVLPPELVRTLQYVKRLEAMPAEICLGQKTKRTHEQMLQKQQQVFLELYTEMRLYTVNAICESRRSSSPQTS